MTPNKNKITTISFSIIFNVLLLFPLVVQFFHVLEGEKHSICYENSTHLHKTKSNCKICSFSFASYTYNPIATIANKTFNDYKKTTTNFYSYLHTSNFNISESLRAPPLFS